jgi:hypothetical protein
MDSDPVAKGEVAMTAMGPLRIVSVRLPTVEPRPMQKETTRHKQTEITRLIAQARSERAVGAGERAAEVLVVARNRPTKSFDGC